MLFGACTGRNLRPGDGKTDILIRPGRLCQKDPGICTKIIKYKMFRPRAQCHGAADKFTGAAGQIYQWQLARSPVKRNSVTHLNQFAINEIHGRGTDEAGDKPVGRSAINIFRCISLLDRPFVQYHNLGCQRHGFDLIVGDIDNGPAKPFMKTFQFNTHIGTQFGIKVR